MPNRESETYRQAAPDAHRAGTPETVLWQKQRQRQRERSVPYGSGAPELWKSSVANVGVFTHSPTIQTETGSFPRAKSIQAHCSPAYPLDTQEELPGMDIPMGHRSVLFGLWSENTWLEFSEAKSMPVPRVAPDAIGMPSLKPSGTHGVAAAQGAGKQHSDLGACPSGCRPLPPLPLVYIWPSSLS